MGGWSGGSRHPADHNVEVDILLKNMYWQITICVAVRVSNQEVSLVLTLGLFLQVTASGSSPITTL